VRALARRRQVEAAVEEELQFHLEQETRANVARGLPPAEARRAAVLALGGVTQTTERVRAVRTMGFSALGRDIRHGVRALATSPRFTLVALLTTVLMVAGMTTVFTLVNAALLRPLPYPASDRLVFIEPARPLALGTGVSLNDATMLRQRSRSFDLWGLYSIGSSRSHRRRRQAPALDLLRRRLVCSADRRR
jgi:hypothetical protein